MKKVIHPSGMKVLVTSLGKDPRPCDVLAEGERKYNREWPGILQHPEEVDVRERVNEHCSFEETVTAPIRFQHCEDWDKFLQKGL